MTVRSSVGLLFEEREVPMSALPHRKLSVLLVLILALVFLLLACLPASAAPMKTMSQMPSYSAYVNPFTRYANPFTYYVNPYTCYYNPFWIY